MMHQDQYMALFIVDIDKFKNINDTLGHYYGGSGIDTNC